MKDEFMWWEMRSCDMITWYGTHRYIWSYACDHQYPVPNSRTWSCDHWYTATENDRVIVYTSHMITGVSITWYGTWQLHTIRRWSGDKSEDHISLNLDIEIQTSTGFSRHVFIQYRCVQGKKKDSTCGMQVYIYRCVGQYQRKESHIIIIVGV